MSNVYFGIDLGTSQCSVAYVVDSSRTRSQQIIDPQVVALRRQEASAAKPSDRFPSIIGSDFADKRRKHLLFAWDFLALFERKHRGRLDPVRRGRDFFQSVKSDMGTNRVYPFSKLPSCQTPVAVTARLIEQLARLVGQERPDLDPRKGHTVITVPASFSALAREDTLAAAELAGFSRDRMALLDEPVAALLDSVNHQDAGTFLSDSFQNVLMFDYGGGTCDLALMRVRLRNDNSLGLHIETLAISPYRKLGGDDVDREVMNAVIWPDVCSVGEKANLSPTEVEAVNDTLTIAVARLLKEQICDQARTQIKQKGRWPSLASLRPAIVRPRLRFSVDGVDFPKEFTLTAERFANDVMRAFTEVPADFDDEDDCPRSLARPIWETLDRAGVAADDLHRVIFNGASSMNPFVRRMLEERLREWGAMFSGIEFAETPSLTCSVARGAALACYWQRARGEQLVAPIMPEPLGVIVQNGPPEEILAAGTALPFPGSDELHIVTGRLFVPPGCGPEMLVPYYTGRAGSPPVPRHAGTVKLPLPPGTVAGSDVTIRLRVDDDKVLHWWFSIGSEAPVPAESVHDPWTRHVPTLMDHRLFEHRRKLRESIDGGVTPPFWMLLEEANLMRRAGDPETAILAVNDLIERDGATGNALNVRGLSYDGIGDSDRALADYKAAAELKPDQPIFRGNYGCALEEAGRLEEATAAIRMALRVDPNLGYLYERLAEIARQQGREQDARRELQQAERLAQAAAERDPLNPEPWEHLASVRSALGDYEGAAKAFELAQEADKFIRLGGSTKDVVTGAREGIDEKEWIQPKGPS